MKLENFVTSFSIFFKYCNSNVVANKDEIIILGVSPENIAKNDIEILKKIGWVWLGKYWRLWV